MKDKEISEGGKCRTGKGRTKVQGWNLQDWKMTDKSAAGKNVEHVVQTFENQQTNTSD